MSRRSATLATAAGPSDPHTLFLDAAERCLHRGGIRRTTMTKIAAEAGVSRAWLYRHFPDKASLLGAALIRQDEQFWAEAEARIAPFPGLSAQIAEAVRYSRQRQSGPLVLRLRASEPAACAAVLGVGLRQAMPGMALFWRPYLEAAKARGEVRANLDTARAAEWVMRIVLSLVTVPGEAVDVDDPEAVLGFVEEFLMTGLGEGHARH